MWSLTSEIVLQNWVGVDTAWAGSLSDFISETLQFCYAQTAVCMYVKLILSNRDVTFSEPPVNVLPVTGFLSERERYGGDYPI